MRWKPAHETHAIERVAASFLFTEPLPSRQFNKLIIDATPHMEGLGFNSSMDEADAPVGAGLGGFGPIIQFSVGAPGAPQPMGRRYRVLAGNDILEEAIFTRTQFGYATHRYTRWSDMLERVRDIFAPFLTSALEFVPISTIKLEYWDRFIWTEKPGDVDYGELFSPQLKYVPSFGINLKDLWHSHVGFFADTPEPVKRLVNLNIDVVNVAEASPEAQPGPQNLRRSAGIYTMAQDTWATPPDALTFDQSLSQLADQHTILVTVMCDILTERAANRIALDKNEHA